MGELPHTTHAGGAAASAASLAAFASLAALSSAALDARFSLAAAARFWAAVGSAAWLLAAATSPLTATTGADDVGGVKSASVAAGASLAFAPCVSAVGAIGASGDVDGAVAPLGWPSAAAVTAAAPFCFAALLARVALPGLAAATGVGGACTEQLSGWFAEL